VFVDPTMLHAGGNDSRRAGEYARQAASALTQVALSSEMFGNFAAAVAFHESITSNHAHYVIELKAQREVLTAVGEKAYRATEGFSGTDYRNAIEMGSVSG
jgi:F0F1-type ATP synthase delta subunit